MKIQTAYDAYWFLFYHPNFSCSTRILLTDEEAEARKVQKRQKVPKTEVLPYPDTKIIRMKDTIAEQNRSYWVEVTDLPRRAIQVNLDIHYAKVDKTGTINDDKRKNKYDECWLEFGELYYEIINGHLVLQTVHDYKLDCGAETFDKALIKLARLVKKHYGTYTKKERAA